MIMRVFRARAEKRKERKDPDEVNSKVREWNSKARRREPERERGETIVSNAESVNAHGVRCE